MPRRCKASWIDTYLQYTQNQESPTAFHEWTAMSVIGACAGRNVWIPRIKYTLYPNLFVILVAGSARCRKSSALALGVDILKSIEKPPMVFAQKITNEALIQALEEAKIDGASCGIVCASELSVFMGMDAIKSGIIPTLTDLYDSPKEWVYHTRGRGKEVLRNVTLAVLAASTPDWLRCSVPADAVGGGFTSRIVFVYQDRPSTLVLFHDDSCIEEELKSSLVADLNHIRMNIRGPMSFTPQAKIEAEEWYRSSSTVVRDAKLDGYFGRKHDIMFKIAAVLSLSEGDDRVISHTHIQRALRLLEENEHNLGAIIASVVASQVGGATEKVLDTIKRAGTISHTELLRKCWRFASSVEVGTMLNTLLESREIEEEFATDKKTKMYKVRRHV